MSRSLGYGSIGAIPFSELLAGVAYAGVDPHGMHGQRWVALLRAMDMAYVVHVNGEIQRGVSHG